MQYICKLLCALLMCFMLPCHGRDAITTGSSLVTEGDTLVSAGKRFELGFFLDEQHSNCYVGIWYYKLSPQTIVWVANRDFPVQDSEGAVGIKEDGNLCVVDNTGATYFSTQLDPTPSKSHRTARTARLLDSGNLVLIDDLSGETLWQSFDNPADTFLPGMKMDDSLTLTSWASSGYNPTPGNYTFIQDPEDKNLYTIKKRTLTTHWKSLSGIPLIVSSLLSNFSGKSSSRLLMNSSGEIQFYSWDSKKVGWSLQWSEPHDRCSVYNVCGNFGSCSINNNGSHYCKCLQGFEPTNPRDWGANEFSGGCSRKPAISCDQTVKRDTFLNLTSVVFGNPASTILNSKSEEECRQECLGYCECQGYSYSARNPALRPRRTGNLTLQCKIWTSDFIDLHEDSINGLNLSIRIATPDVELTGRSCPTCGDNIIPYPLSSQPGCGDPLYYSFSCNQSIGDLSFQTLNGSYPVTDFSLENRSFVIEVPVENSDSCNYRNPADKVILLNSSLPFNVKNWCYNDTGHLLSQGKNSIEISWNPPSEPTCSASTDCEDWPNSICNDTKQGQGRCLCKSGFKWDALSLNCSSVMTVAGSSSERTKSSVKFRSVIISISVILAVVILCSIGCIIYRRNLVRKRKDKRIVGNQLNNLANIGDQEDELLTEDDKKAIDIPFFSLETILAATENFSDANKLGQGGFGPVYKPAFVARRRISEMTSSSSSKITAESQNDFTISLVGR
nr:G-type lectin S-receptor-like serine/threonine-protein kinase At4g03230 isoform X2 [Ipomoea batatas]